MRRRFQYQEKAFAILLVSHTLAAYFQPIQDCDEVFNYWEPTHYLSYGNGFQTWEYSPEFAIRSWAYAGLHALATLPIHLCGGSKLTEFYALRVILGIVCALCEIRLYCVIARTLNARIAIVFLAILAMSPGIFHASISYLPSSFAMYFACLGMGAFMDRRGGSKVAKGIWLFGIGATLGWPFVAALSVPYLLEECFLALIGSGQYRADFAWTVMDGVLKTLFALMLQIGVDCFFYKKLTIVPLNIVLYNVFGSKGPDLYGTEPWHFYLRNLTLNFHLWVPLALSSMPLLLLRQRSQAMRSNWVRLMVFLLPFYLWLGLFTMQPHKEERFMYPAYPALALNAAVATDILVGTLPPRLHKYSLALLLLAGAVVSLFRIIGIVTAFAAPFSIYTPLHAPNVSQAGDTVCLGKEWYRFPSHYHLPSDVKAKFIKSEFRGLLPGEFSEAGSAPGLFPGTWVVPSGMNDENRENMDKYTDLRHCTFMIDSTLPSTIPTEIERNFVDDDVSWRRLHCERFLDASATGLLPRLGYVPEFLNRVKNMGRIWGEYCLLKSKP
ncbi:glycosyltransferase family 22 protein [Piedraia hortae CBS 480.64]|uniref:Mannosyltransferase n=1 Tax=Piedraia hortae CBS 480.64 TaxID=1314780 RepID=A0A6A7BS91_9PEZI|nr:glycosyltransferase family 22 protein [Piedraia hortae CBS 480.64]